MAESFELHCQEAPYTQKIIEEERVVANYLVTAVEMADGRFIDGNAPYDDQPTMTMVLDWESEKAERVADFYAKHLAKEPQSTDGWNCHKFVVDVMGWEVLWSDNAYPRYLTLGKLTVKTSALLDQTPYAIKGKVAPGVRLLSHSMLGLQNPDYTLGVDGHGAGLWIKPHSAVMEKYGNKIYRQYTPLTQRLGKVGRILQPWNATKAFSNSSV